MAGTLLQMSIARVLLGLAESRLDLQKTESGWISGPRFAGQVGRVMSQLDYQPFIHACANDRLDVAKWLWSVCPVDYKQAMLSARSYVSFMWACGRGHLPIAQWLWRVCPNNKKQAMLSAIHYYTFIEVCKNGHLEVAQWLWSVCPVEGRQAMLSANNYVSFRFACEGVCLDVVEWLWSVCPDEDKQEMLSSVNTDRLRAQVCELLATFRKDLDDRVDECNTAVVPTSFGRRG